MSFLALDYNNNNKKKTYESTQRSCLILLKLNCEKWWLIVPQCRVVWLEIWKWASQTVVWIWDTKSGVKTLKDFYFKY